MQLRLPERTPQPMTDNLRDRIAAVIAGIACCDTHHGEPEKFDLDAADAVTDLLIDMAGKGELLKSIDGMHR
jgi:hypothetical protein